MESKGGLVANASRGLIDSEVTVKFVKFLFDFDFDDLAGTLNIAHTPTHHRGIRTMDSDAVYGGDVEVSLQLHVRSILHDYILEHLTIDQVQYTTSMVSQVRMVSQAAISRKRLIMQFISDSLTTIPNHEPSTLTFPVDPLDSLRTMLKLDSLEPYDETFTVDADAISYIKSQLFATKCKPKSQKIWDDMDPGMMLAL